MSTVNSSAFPVIEPTAWSDLPVGAFMTTRAGGVSHGPYGDIDGQPGLNLGLQVGDEPAAVLENQRILASRMPDSPVWLEQVHGSAVYTAGARRPADRPQADASVTDRPGTVLAILTADCLPVLLVDPEAGVIGAAHGGWRGLAGEVLLHTVDAMTALGARAGRIRAWLGAAIGPRRFEVGAEVPEAFIRLDQQMTDCFSPHPGKAGKWFGDLHQIARYQLSRVGVRAISAETACTVEDRRFYSFRRDRICGRMGSFVWLT